MTKAVIAPVAIARVILFIAVPFSSITSGTPGAAICGLPCSANNANGRHAGDKASDHPEDLDAAENGRCADHTGQPLDADYRS